MNTRLNEVNNRVDSHLMPIGIVFKCATCVDLVIRLERLTLFNLNVNKNSTSSEIGLQTYVGKSVKFKAKLVV